MTQVPSSHLLFSSLAHYSQQRLCCRCESEGRSLTAASLQEARVGGRLPYFIRINQQSPEATWSPVQQSPACRRYRFLNSEDLKSCTACIFYFIFDILANWDMMSLKTKSCLFILHSFCIKMVSTYETLHISYIFSTSITNIDHI